MKTPILCGVLICLIVGCDEPAPVANVPVNNVAAAAPPKIGPEEPRGEGKMEANRQGFLEINRQIIAKANKDIEDHTAAMQDKDDVHGREHHEKLIALAEQEKSKAEETIKKLEAVVAKQSN